MRIDLNMLDELNSEHFNNYDTEKSVKVSILTDALSNYMYGDTSETITELLIQYNILIPEITTETPIVKPHRFTENG